MLKKKKNLYFNLFLVIVLFFIAGCSKQASNKNQITDVAQQLDKALVEERQKEEEPSIVSGVLYKTDFKKISNLFFDKGAIYSISFDGREFQVVGKKGNHYEQVYLSGNHLAFVRKKEVSPPKSAPISFSHIIDVGELKGIFAIKEKVDFVSWEIFSKNGQFIYKLDKEKEMNAETGQAI